MGAELVGIYGTAIGAIIAGIFTVINRKFQIKDEMVKLELQRGLADSKEKSDKLSSRKEELFCLIQTISFGFSMTQNYRMKQMNFSTKAYNLHYEKMNQLVLRAELLTQLYFPEVIDEVKNINVLTNVIWGQQQRYFGSEEYAQNQRQEILNEFAKYSSQLVEKCSLVMELLCDFNDVG